MRDDSENLANRHLRAAELLGAMQQRAKDNLSLVSQHLYVYDGDLTVEVGMGRGEPDWIVGGPGRVAPSPSKGI